MARGSVLTIVGVGLGLAALAHAEEVKDFDLVTLEWTWRASARERAVTDRNRGAVREMGRYTFDPPFLIVNKGDTVVLHIHALHGVRHVVEMPELGVPETAIERGQEKAVRFVAARAGTFRLMCKTHATPDGKGPMVGTCMCSIST